MALSAAIATTVLTGAHAFALEGIETSRVTSTIAPGLELTEFDRFDQEGWIRGDVLTANLAEPSLRPAYLSPPAVSQSVPLSESVARAGAVAGVNGDFFDIDVTEAPLGVGLDAGELRHSPSAGHNTVVSVGDKVGRMMRIFLDAKFRRADGSVHPVSDLNAPKVTPDGIGLYTPLWGAASRASAVDGAQRVTEVELVDGVVTRIADAPAEGPIPSGAVRLLGVDGGADLLRSLRQGERIGVEYRPRTDGPPAEVAIGGDKVLLRDGVVAPVDDTERHPRTAAGFSADGKRMWLVTVDGRQADSRGMTEVELAEELKSLGADDALNLDGGGSSTLMARERGGVADVHNAPSDGELRPVPNGIGFATAAGSGSLSGFRVEPALSGEHSDRVLSGLTRRMRAYGHDETGAPVGSAPEWTVQPSENGSMEGDLFRAVREGTARVRAAQGGTTGEARLSILGPVSHLSTDVERMPLLQPGSRGRFRVLGYDRDGFETWVEPTDVQLEYDPKLVRVTASGDGFDVEALAPGGATIAARVGDHVTHFGVTVGAQPRVLSPMDGVEGWRAVGYPAPVRAALAKAEGREGTPGLAVDYSLTGTTETRAAYVNAEPMVDLPAGTQKLGAWVNGDGKGGWLRSTIVDSAGVSSTVDLARNVDWTGWRYVETAIPSGVSGPLKMQRLYVVEPDPNRQYEGRLVFDDLTALVAPEVEVPEDPQPQDPSVVVDGSLPAGNRIAVVSDAQFTSDDPDGPLVRKARQSLREALAARPEAVVLNGDFVDRGTAADFDLARQVIESELGNRVPWYYVPGNHETYGPGDLSEFTAEFGPTHRVADLGSTRLVFLDSSRGSLREGGFEQVHMLKDALDGAEKNPSITSVSVFLHHPIEDPAPADASELSDAKEADLLSRWLTEFERDSGKPAAAVTAHAGAFHASSVDGVQYLVNGNAGKTPALAPDAGGFTGSSVLRIDPSEEEPVSWTTRPHVDELRLDVPGSVDVGKSLPVRAQIRQGERLVPVTYPVSADWESSDSVHIGAPEDAGPDQVAAFDPATGMVVGLRPGAGELSVTTNGVTQSARFSVVS